MKSLRLFKLYCKYTLLKVHDKYLQTFYSTKFCFDDKNKYFQLRY